MGMHQLFAHLDFHRDITTRAKEESAAAAVKQDADTKGYVELHSQKGQL